MRWLAIGGNHRDFTRIFLDAYVVLGAGNCVLRFNQAFCNLVNLRPADVRKLGDLAKIFEFNESGVDESISNLLATTDVPIRIADVQATLKENANETSSPIKLKLILSCYPFKNSAGERLGSCVLIRDVTAEIKLQGQFQEKTFWREVQL